MMRLSTPFLIVLLATLLVSVFSLRLGDSDDEDKPKSEKKKDGKAKVGKAKEGKAKEGKVGKEGKDGKAVGGKIEQGSKEDVWYQATNYLKKFKKDGSKVNQDVKADLLPIGGGEVRGMVTNKAMEPKTKLVVIPKTAWVNLDNFPEMRDSNLQCSGAAENELKIATALAIEDVLGEKSKWKPYLDTLPTKDDFHAFYPKWAEESLLDEFGDLKLAQDLKDFQKSDTSAAECWKKWQSTSDVKHVKKVTWEHVKLGLARWRSRNHNTSDDKSNHSHALLPAADLMNTGPSVNTKWYFEDSDGDGHADQYILEIGEEGVKPGDELLERYCASCKNDDMLNIWGIYVEDNDNHMDKQEKGCDSLLPLVKPMLEAEKPAGLLAPRCKEETVKKDQGPMRCSFARLAWESCAQEESKKEEKKDAAAPPAPAAPGKVSMIEEGMLH